MLCVPFNPQHGLVIVQAAVHGPSGSAVLRLALDTGATATVINVGMLVALGYYPALAPDGSRLLRGAVWRLSPGAPSTKLSRWDRSARTFQCSGRLYPLVLALTGC